MLLLLAKCTLSSYFFFSVLAAANSVLSRLLNVHDPPFESPGMSLHSITYVQLNKYETDLYFLQNFQSNTTACSIIQVFCKNYKREIVFVLICRTARTISGSQLLQNKRIIKQTVLLLWKFWRKYGSISYPFSCIMGVKIFVILPVVLI